MKRNILFVLGAGASKGAVDTPIGRELVWDYSMTDSFSEIRNNGSIDNSRSEERFSNYEKFLKKIGDYFPEYNYLHDKFKNRGMELISFGDLPKKHYIDEVLLDAYKKKDLEFVKIIRWLIFQHLIHFQEYRNGYNDFKKYLLKIKNTNNIDIISFNFDCYLHGNIETRKYFDYKVDFTKMCSYSGNFNENKICDLIKPHGSLDWMYCPECKEKYIRGYDFGYALHYEKCYNENCDGILEPFILLPHEDRDEEYDKLIQECRSKIKNADRIYVIGYSFPDYDFDINNLFQDNVNQHTELFIVDYLDDEGSKNSKNSIKYKMNSFFPLIEKKYYFKGFKRWLSEIINNKDDSIYE